MQNASKTMPLKEIVDQVDKLVQARRFDEARQITLQLQAGYPDLVDVWLMGCRVAQSEMDALRLRQCADKALSLRPDSWPARLYDVEALIFCGQTDVATSRLEALENEAGDSIVALQNIAVFYTNMSSHFAARRVYERAVKLDPNNPQVLYNYASALISVGDLSGADIVYSKVLALKPDDFDAYYNRSTLRRQTVDENHVAELKMAFEEYKGSSGVIQIGYALAKELEDLGEYSQGFFYLKEGAGRRRANMSYRVEEDLETMSLLQKTFDETFFKRLQSEVRAAPIFVLGLPRSGSTLVDRILSSHSEVGSLGEINDFVMSVMRIAGPAKDKKHLIQKTATMDLEALGAAYASSLEAHRRTETHLIDKTPLNFLYLGLILKALPKARIVHLRRHPMDNCYAIYKTLFRMGYPFSYDLQDIGRYYLCYHDLMEHWREMAPDRIIDVSYEDLVSDQEGTSRELVAACGLDWQDACLNFQDNKETTFTASAAQVRQPIYTSSVGLWKRYGTELTPLCKVLRQGGLEV